MKQLYTVTFTATQIKYIRAILKYFKVHRKNPNYVDDAVDVLSEELDNAEEVYTDQELEKN